MGQCDDSIVDPPALKPRATMLLSVAVQDHCTRPGPRLFVGESHSKRGRTILYKQLETFKKYFYGPLNGSAVHTVSGEKFSRFARFTK